MVDANHGFGPRTPCSSPARHQASITRTRNPRLHACKTALAVVILFAALCASGCAGFFINGDTTTTLTSSATAATYGTSITLTAAVSPTAATGTITFYDGTTSLGTGTLSSGTATLAVTTLAVGTHSITAVYGADATYRSSTSSAVSIVVSTALTATTTTLAASASSITYGTSLVLTATVSSTAATGTVTFYNGTAVLGTGTVALGVATFTTTTLAVGTNSLTAAYVGDSTYSTSTSGTVSVDVIATTTDLSSSLTTPACLSRGVLPTVRASLSLQGTPAPCTPQV